MAHQAKMAKALWRSIPALRMVGIIVAMLARSSFPDDAKRDELTALLQEYEQYIHDSNVVDQAAVLQKALQHLESSTILSDAHWGALLRHLLAPLGTAGVRRLLWHQAFAANRIGSRFSPAAPLSTQCHAPSPAIKPPSDAEGLAFSY